jgi:hypothetical protein
MFDLYEELLKEQSLAEVMKFAAGRAQGAAMPSDDVEASTVREAVGSAPTIPVPYSPFECGTDDIPITVDLAEVAA